MARPRRASLTPAVTGTLILLGGALVILWLGGPQAETASVAVALGHGVAGAAMWRRSRELPGRERSAWRLAALGFGAASAGVVVVAALSVAVGDIPAFGATDTIFLGSYTLVLSGLIGLTRLDYDRPMGYRMFVDGLVGAVSLATIAWVSFQGAIAGWLMDAQPMERVVGGSYIVFDVAVLITVMIVVLRRGSMRFDQRLLFVGLGASLQAVADLTYLAAGAGSSFADAQPNFPLFVIASAMYLSAGARVAQRPTLHEYEERQAAWWSLVAPYALAISMIGVLVRHVYSSDPSVDTTILLVGTLLVGMLVVFRQSVAILENRRIVERQRSALVASISHELRTPLTAMVGFLNLVVEHGDDLPRTERDELLSVVHDQAQYLGRIVSDLVMLARDSGRSIEPDRRWVDLGAVVVAAVNDVDGAEKGIDLQIQPGIRCHIDTDRVRQALVNLLSNSVKYGGKQRLVSAKVLGRTAVIEVHDDGPGIARRYQSAVWERFERGENRLNATSPGSGIGLAIVEAVANAHGGRAAYRRSELLGGACFSLMIPLSEGLGTEPAPTAPAVGSSAA